MPQFVNEFSQGWGEVEWSARSVLAEYAQAGAAERAWDVYLRVVRLRPDDVTLRLEVARAEARFGRWSQAAADYAELLRRRPESDAEVWFESACLCQLADDRDGYAKTRAAVLRRAEVKHDLRPFLVARACTLAPEAADLDRAARIAAEELAGMRDQYAGLTQQAALEVRAGHPDKAVPLLRQCLKGFPY